jgi:hypothetical protein
VSHATLLRTLVLAEWCLLLLAAIVDISLESSLPAPLAAHVAAESETFFGSWPPAVAIALTMTLLLSLISSIGLLFLSPWSRVAYLATMILGFAVSPFMGPQVMTAPGATLGQAAAVVSGILLAGLYMGPFRDLFPKRAA